MKKIIFSIFLMMLPFVGAQAATQPSAKDIIVNTSGFNKNLNSTDNTVQKALNTMDQTVGGGSTPVGPTNSLQTNAGGGTFGYYGGNACTGQVISAISATGALTCVNYLTLAGLSGTSPITYNSSTGQIGFSNPGYIVLSSLSASNPIVYNSLTGAFSWTNSNNYIALTALSGSNPITYNNSTGAIGWTNSNNYITLTGLSSTNPGVTYTNSTGVFSQTSGYYYPSTTDQTNWNAKQSALTFANSLQNTAGTVNLVGDATSPGNSFYYGTNGSGTKGFYTIPSQVYPGAGIPNSTGSAWGTSYTTNGSGTVVALITSPTFVTPALGVATATTINKVTITAPASSATLTIANGKTLTINNSLTINSTDGITETTPSTSYTAARTDASNTFTGHQTIEGVTSTGATGTGNFVFSASPTFTGTPVLGTPTATSMTVSGLTATRPVITTTGGLLTTGFYTGNTTTLATSTGSLTPGDCVKIDANGNYIDAGAACGSGGGGSGTVTSIGVNSPNTTIQVSSTPVTTSGTIGVDVNWTDLNSIGMMKMGGINWNDAPNLNQNINWYQVGLITKSAQTTGNGPGILQLFNAAKNAYVNWTVNNNMSTSYQVNWPQNPPTQNQFLSIYDNLGDTNWQNLSQIAGSASNGINWAWVGGYATNNVLTATTAGNATWQAPSSSSGTVNSGTATHLSYYATSTNAVSSLSQVTYSGGSFSVVDNISSGNVSLLAQNTNSSGVGVNAGENDLGYSAVVGVTGSTYALPSIAVVGSYNHSIPLDFIIAGSPVAQFDTGGDLGVGITNTSYYNYETGQQMIDVNNQEFQGNFVSTVSAYGGGISIGQDTGSAVVNGARIGKIEFSGPTDGTGFNGNAYSSAGIAAYATQNWSGSATGSQLVLQTTPNSSTTRTTVLTLGQSGSMTLANASSAAVGHATCWTTGGQIGYCTAGSTIVATGACTCTGL